MKRGTPPNLIGPDEEFTHAYALLDEVNGITVGAYAMSNQGADLREELEAIQEAIRQGVASGNLYNRIKAIAGAISNINNRLHAFSVLLFQTKTLLQNLNQTEKDIFDFWLKVDYGQTDAERAQLIASGLAARFRRYQAAIKMFGVNAMNTQTIGKLITLIWLDLGSTVSRIELWLNVHNTSHTEFIINQKIVQYVGQSLRLAREARIK